MCKLVSNVARATLNVGRPNDQVESTVIDIFVIIETSIDVVWGFLHYSKCSARLERSMVYGTTLEIHSLIRAVHIAQNPTTFLI